MFMCLPPFLAFKVAYTAYNLTFRTNPIVKRDALRLGNVQHRLSLFQLFSAHTLELQVVLFLFLLHCQGVRSLVVTSVPACVLQLLLIRHRFRNEIPEAIMLQVK